MDIDQASEFLAGSMLICSGMAIIGILIVFLNNLFSKYWKPIKWTADIPGMAPRRFATEEELKKTDPKL